jgi:tetratricopeptide (TPR) repeat protein
VRLVSDYRWSNCRLHAPNRFGPLAGSLPSRTTTGGNAQRNKGDLDRAFADYDQAIRLDPKFAFTYYNRGLAWESKRDLQKALTDFKQYSTLAPSDPNGVNAVARVMQAWRRQQRVTRRGIIRSNSADNLY